MDCSFSSVDNSAIALTQSLAFQCGFSLKMDHQGNAVIYASIQNCFAENVSVRQQDAAFGKVG